MANKFMGWWSYVSGDCPYPGLGYVRLNAQPIHGWWNSVGCDSFRDETTETKNVVK
jgi:hypothetical protein